MPKSFKYYDNTQVRVIGLLVGSKNKELNLR